jgi:hypothetical protein
LIFCCRFCRNNLESDTYKYGQNNDFYLDESKRDKYLLQKFYDVINRKDKKEENNQKIDENINKEDDKITQIKNELKEQLKIQNMTRKEYFNYSNKLKKEINKIKDMIESGSKTNYKINNKSTDFNKLEKNTKNEKNINSYTYKSTEKNEKVNKPNNLKMEKNKIILSELNLSNKENEGRKKLKKYNNNVENIKKMNLIDKIPKLTLKKINQKVNKNKGEIKDSKEFKLNQLYNTLSTRLNSNNSELPYKQMNQYFLMYSPKKLPKVNIEKGSNIHGLVETAQNIINDNNIVGFSKLNESLKKDIYDNNNKKFENYKDKGVETENIINLDKKILGLHYEFADSLLTNKRDKYLKSYNK